jgi:hypothetical protein
MTDEIAVVVAVQINLGSEISEIILVNTIFSIRHSTQHYSDTTGAD